MKFKVNAVSRFFFLFTIVWCLMCFAVACTTSWVSEAQNIIQLLVPAITSALGILSAFGVGLTPTVMASVQSWANQATAGLQQVASLINQYNTAEATAQPGILGEVQTVLSEIVSNLSTILPTLHVENPETQAKIVAILQAVQAEMQALVNVVPAIKGSVTSHDELKKLISAVKSPKEFKSEFNTMVAPFGKGYEI